MSVDGHAIILRLVLLAFAEYSLALDLQACCSCISQGGTYCKPDPTFGDADGKCDKCYSKEEIQAGFYHSCTDFCFGGVDYVSHLDCVFDDVPGMILGAVILGLTGTSLLCFCFCYCGLAADRRIVRRRWASMYARLAAPILEPLLNGKSDGSLEPWMKPPIYWTNQNLKVAFQNIFDVEHTRKMVIDNLLRDTMLDMRVSHRKWGATPTGLRLLKLQRIERSDTWVQYLRAKEALRRNRRECTPVDNVSVYGPAKTMLLAGKIGWEAVFFDDLDFDLNELYLWYGTSPESALGISADSPGLSLSHSADANKSFGTSAILEEASSKADEYAKSGAGDYQGVYALVLCRVTCGEMFHVDKTDMASIRKAMKSGKYDSVLSEREHKGHNYREFVFYQEDLIYPEYVVLYHRTYWKRTFR